MTPEKDLVLLGTSFPTQTSYDDKVSQGYRARTCLQYDAIRHTLQTRPILSSRSTDSFACTVY